MKNSFMFRNRLIHFGIFHKRECWEFKLKKQVYNTCTYYTFYRLYLCIGKKAKHNTRESNLMMSLGLD